MNIDVSPSYYRLRLLAETNIVLIHGKVHFETVSNPHYSLDC